MGKYHGNSPRHEPKSVGSSDAHGHSPNGSKTVGTEVHRTRSQRYARLVHERVTEFLGKNAEDSKARREYKARADGFPVMVMQAGLAQAVGFMLAKGQGGEKGYRPYLDDLTAVIGKNLNLTGNTGQSLHECVIKADLMAYRRMTRETLIVAGWFKRFGQAYLSESKGGENDGSAS